MGRDGTLILTRRDVAGLLTMDECAAAVEHAFRSHGDGSADAPGILASHVPGGGFHIKTGAMDLGRQYFVAKTNANFPGNREAGLPTIQGVVSVFDAANGSLLALIDSIEITAIRTGAATAVAAKYLARPGSRAALVCGAGVQGEISIAALMCAVNLRQVHVFDTDIDRARILCETASSKFGLRTSVANDLSNVAMQCDIVVTCTTARVPFLSREHISPGTFIAAVGADSEDKQELEPALLSASKIVVDIREQSASIGELHHAIKAGTAVLGDVHAELGEIVAGKRPGREHEDETIIFDSTGMALQDVAAAAIVYEKAASRGSGVRVDLNGA